MLDANFITIILALLALWLMALSAVILKAFHTYRSLTADIDKKDFATVLTELKKHTKTTDKIFQTHSDRFDSIDTRLESHIQKLGFVRYNPFGNTGGDQSFCLCLLDEHDNGILVTSLHTRQQTRLYTKEIVLGKPIDKGELSKEEADCLKKAKKWSQS